MLNAIATMPVETQRATARLLRASDARADGAQHEAATRRADLCAVARARGGPASVRVAHVQRLARGEYRVGVAYAPELPTLAAPVERCCFWRNVRSAALCCTTPVHATSGVSVHGDTAAVDAAAVRTSAPASTRGAPLAGARATSRPSASGCRATLRGHVRRAHVWGAPMRRIVSVEAPQVARRWSACWSRRSGEGTSRARASFRRTPARSSD